MKAGKPCCPTDRPTAYRIFLLTCWLDEAGDPADPETWRFRLEEPKSGRGQGCVGVTALVVRLIHKINNDANLLNDFP